MADYFVNDATGSDIGNDGLSSGQAFKTIQAALTAAPAGSTIHVAGGVYTGNLVITKSVTLLGDGSGTTTINGNQAGGELGTIQVSGGVNAVTIDGFKVVGIDGTPGLEKAAVYLQGAHNGVTITNNEIVAAGDSAITSEYAATVSNVLIDNNVFSGATFNPALPLNDFTTFGNDQFTITNVPRPVVYFGNTPTKSGIVFTNNVVATQSGSIDASGDFRGNVSVVLDGTGHTATGNSFEGLNNVAGASDLDNAPALRMRGTGHTANNNDFDTSVTGGIDNTSEASVVSSFTANPSGDDYFFAGPAANEVFSGGAGSDTIDMTAAGVGGSSVDLATGVAFSTATGFDTLSGIENVKGSAGLDVIFGADGVDNTFIATTGNDSVNGRGDGANGDTFDASSASAAITVDLNGGATVGAFTTTLANIENVKTGSGNDTITLSSAANTVDAGGGFDTAISSSSYASTSITWNDADGLFEVGADSLKSVEKVEMSDRDVWLVSSDADLANALAGAGTGDVIVLAPGPYNMNITLESGVDIVGLSESGVIINGSIIVPAGLTDVTVKGLTVHNASSTGYLLDMRAAANSTLTDVAFEDVTFELVSDFLPVNGPGTFSNDSPIGNSFSRGTITLADGVDADTAGLTFTNVTMDSGGYAIGSGEALANIQVGGKVIMDGVQVIGTVAANLGAQVNISGNGANDSIDFVNGGTSGGGNLYISGFEHVVVDGNTFTNQGIALNGAKDATVTGNTFQDIGPITSNGTQHRGLTIEDAWGTDGVSGLTITGNTFQNISAPDGAISFGRFTDGGATIANLDDVTIADNTFTNVHTEIHTDTASFSVPGAVLPDDFDGDHLALATAGDDDLDGTSGVDIIFADAGNDMINGAAGNDAIDGGTGTDEAVYSGTLTSASFTYAGGVWSVTGVDGTDTLEGIERVTDASGNVFFLVGSDGSDGFAHIQDAIDAALGGETILIAPGTYTESSVYVGLDLQGLYIDKPNLTLVGFSSDTGSAVTSADDARDFGPTVIAGAENMFGANHWIDAGGTGTVITGLHLQAGTETGNKLLEIWADGTSVTDSFIDVNEGGTTYTGAIAVYYNEDGTHQIGSYTLSDNILNEGVMVANGVGNTGSAVNQAITGNSFIGADRYDTITLQGQVAGVGWLLSPIGLPTITGNTLDGNTTPFLLRFADDNLDSNLSLSYIEDFLANNTDADTAYAYVLTSTGDLRITPRDYDGAGSAGPSDNYYVTNTIDTLNLALDTTGDVVFGGQRITQQSGDTVIVQSGSGAVDSQIMVNNLTVLATENSVDLDLTLATHLADGTPIAGGGVQSITLADYATGQGANVDVTGNGLANTIIGNSGKNSIVGSAGNDSLVGGGGADTLLGGADNDTITGGTGNDSIDGGAGTDDTVIFSGNINEYNVEYDVNTLTYAVTHLDTSEIDHVTGVEKFSFNGTVRDVTGDPNLIANRFDPSFSSGTTANFNENVANPTVYTAVATDADSAAVFGNVVYSLEGPDAGLFTINSSTGVVKFTGTADFEAEQSYAITVKATQGITSSTRSVTVSVNNLNDNNPVFQSGNSASVAENTAASAVVYDANATDADASGTFGAIVYSLSGTDASAFTIDAATGQVRLKAPANFEVKAGYAFAVTATQGSTATTQNVALAVNNVSEGVPGQLETIDLTLESGSTKSPVGTLGTTAGTTFEVMSVSPGGGTVLNGTTVLAAGQTLTLAQANALTFSSGASSGNIQLQAHNGVDTTTVTVNLNVTPAVNATYTGTSAANRIDGAGGNDSILGNGGADSLIGGAGKDTISGGGGKDTINGGLGKDVLTGGNKADQFVFDTKLSSSKFDTITDFSHGTDKIALDNALFAVGSALTAKEFYASLDGKAHDGSDRIIYETDTGKLSYDADGNGAGKAIHFATLSNLAAVTLDDFVIV